jgi:hypothetical protein
MKYFLRIGVSLFIFSFLFGCSSETPPDVKLVNEIRKVTAKKLKENKDLYLIGTGSQMMYDIQMLAMSFNYYHEVDLKTARELIISVIDEFLIEINDKKEIRPYLSNYPFTAKNVEIRLFIYGPDRRELSPEKIGCVSSIAGVLEYYTRSDKDHPICKETYDEALGKISSSQELETTSRSRNCEETYEEALDKIT